MAPERLIPLKVVSDEYPHFTLRQLQRLVHTRQIRYYKLGGKVMLAPSDLDAFVEAGRVDPVDATDPAGGEPVAAAA